MKRIRLLVLSCVFLLGFVACGTGEDTTAPDVTTAVPETTAPPEEEVKIEGWYLYEKPSNLFAKEGLGHEPEEDPDYGLKVPLVYSARVGDFDVTVDFFQELWPLETCLQMRVDVRNHTNTDVVYYSNSMDFGYFQRSDGKVKQFDIMALHSVAGYFIGTVVTVDGVVVYEADLKDRIPARGEEPEYFERVFYVDPTFFVPDSAYTYTFCFTLQEYIEDADEVKTREPRVITVEIPVTVETIQ